MRTRPFAASDDDDEQPHRPQSAGQHRQHQSLNPSSQQQPSQVDSDARYPSPTTARSPASNLSFSSSKFDAARHSDTIDRRKAEKGIKAQLAHNDWESPPSFEESEILRREQPQEKEEQQQPGGKSGGDKDVDNMLGRKRIRWRSPWRVSMLTLLATTAAALLLFGILRSFLTRQVDPKGCKQCYMWPAYAKLDGFDTEHTRFASKYSLYLYREVNVDEETKVKGIPVLFITGNAGSYKQVRPIASEAAHYFAEYLQQDSEAIKNGARSLDFFTADFNEDITAFHGQTLLDQAEYLNDAVAYILSLYHDPHRSRRDPGLPDPTSVIIVGHSMGGIVARTMLIMPNYQSNSINTILTMSTPHARAPVSFDADIVSTYQKINDYWRAAYSQKWANDNPLWHVTLVSIAGGGLDNIVPSDYASLASLVPDTHGFTVFTSSIPGVWTGSDHLSILWCDQFRKVMVRALLEVVDANRPGQTKPRAHRMKIFKKWFLTGMERVAEKSLPDQEPTTLLTLEDNSNSILAAGERLSLQGLGKVGKPKPHLLPIPPHSGPGSIRFNLLSNQPLDYTGASGSLEVLFCSVFPLHHGHSASLFSMNMDLSGSTAGSTRLACKNAAADVIKLPASTQSSTHPFDDAPPMSYLQFDAGQLMEHQFVAVVDKGQRTDDAWVMAEFAEVSQSVLQTHIGLRRLLTHGLQATLPAGRPMVTEVKIPAIHSSLLAYNLKLSSHSCGDGAEKFTPLLRQYLSDPFESKFFVNVKEANINLHGIAPFMPPALRAHAMTDGISLQLWSDPTCGSSIDLSLQVDLFGSLGKLYMRYRTVFPAIPLVIVALVLRKQFMVHDQTGIFMPFTEALDLCLRTSLPVLLLAMTIFGMSLAASSSHPAGSTSAGPLSWRRNSTETVIDYTKNDILLGSQDPFFWFLVPLSGLVCAGICVAVNHLALLLVHLCTFVASSLASIPALLRHEDPRRSTPGPAFASSSPRRRIIVTSILLFLVSTIIPYQFAYMVACVVQVATCTRALWVARETRSGTHYNFFNYAHSVLVLMLWVMPINIPVLIVWWHNLAVHWLTPFSSHHNVLSIMPFILLVETLTGGKMLPRLSTQFRYITNLLFFFLAVYAALYGITFAYQLHHLANLICAWLVVLHFSTTTFSVAGLSQLLEGEDESGRGKKRP